MPKPPPLIYRVQELIPLLLCICYIMHRPCYLFVILCLTLPGFVSAQTSCWTDRPYNGVNYSLCINSVPQAIAQINCTQRNMTLATFLSDDTFLNFQAWLKTNYANNEVWVGATYSLNRSSFVWSSGESVPWSMVPDNKVALTDGLCLRFNTSKILNPLNCDLGRVFLCMEILTTTTTSTVATTTSPTATTTNPTVVTTTNTTPTTTQTTAVQTSTTTSATSGNSSALSSDCWCGCTHKEIPTNQTLVDKLMEKEIAAIKEVLHIDVTSLSSTLRKLTSADDQRPSAKSVGYVGVVIMSVVFLLIVLMDSTYLIQFVHSIAVKLKHKKS